MIVLIVQKHAIPRNYTLAPIPFFYSDAVAQMAQIVQVLGRIQGQQSERSGGANGVDRLKSHAQALEFPDDIFPYLPLN